MSQSGSLTQDTAHAGAERSNLVGALLESIDVPWTERTQSIYVRHLPARTIGFTYGSESRGQAGTVTPVPFVYVEFFTALQAHEVMQRVEEGLRVQAGYDPHLGNALRVHVPPTSRRGAVDTKVRVAMAGEEPKVLDPLRDRDLVLDGNDTVWRVHIPDPGFSLANPELRVRFARLLGPLPNQPPTQRLGRERLRVARCHQGAHSRGEWCTRRTRPHCRCSDRGHAGRDA